MSTTYDASTAVGGRKVRFRRKARVILSVGLAFILLALPIWLLGLSTYRGIPGKPKGIAIVVSDEPELAALRENFVSIGPVTTFVSCDDFFARAADEIFPIVVIDHNLLDFIGPLCVQMLKGSSLPSSNAAFCGIVHDAKGISAQRMAFTDVGVTCIIDETKNAEEVHGIVEALHKAGIR